MSTDPRAQLAELRRLPMSDLKQRWRDLIGGEPTRALLCRGEEGAVAGQQRDVPFPLPRPGPPGEGWEPD